MLKKIAHKIIHHIMPPLCGSCGVPVAQHGFLCSNCIQDLQFIPSHQCRSCGYPFELDVGQDMLCGQCAQTPPFFDRAYAAFYYKGTARRMILAFKHIDATHLSGTIAYFLNNIITNHNIHADYICSVPLHLKKLFKRQYNQSTLIGHKLSHLSGIPYAPYMLKRKKDGTQKDKTSAQRQSYIRNMFALNRPEAVKGKTIILVDDVMTTGATANEIARYLKKHHAKKVIILTFARVSMSEQDHKTDIEF